MTEVRATVRLQFHREFTLTHALSLVPYFSKLGISHIYASPLLKARCGSMHGYDVVDPSCINPELGGEDALKQLVAALRAHNMGLIVDIVSNHMAVGGDDNPWWQDVLRWGLKSPYSQFFDIQWNSPDPLLKGQLLLPFLRDGYGEVLAAGEISLHFDPELGEFYARHFDHRFPIYPPSYAHILRNSEDDRLLALVHPFEALERDRDGWHAAKPLYQRLSDAALNPEVAISIARALSRYDVALEVKASPTTPVQAEEIQTGKDAHAGDLHPDWQENVNLQRLHQLLELQHYRLASWRTAADDINWRRFFDVNELGGLRVERPEVFEATHAKIFKLIEQGLIDGLRIDHVDGLANPHAYCRKLRRRVDSLIAKRPAGLPTHIPIYVEKILANGETLAQNWNVDGSTGYEFMNQVSLLQHDPCGELLLFDTWSTTTGRLGTFKDEVREARRLVLSSSLVGDVEMVAQGLLLVARTDIATRDLTLGAIRRALIELVVHFPVYRTYANACGRSPQDQAFFDEALTEARMTLAENDWPLLEYLDRWLGGQPLHNLPPGADRKLRQQVLARFQQLTSPAAAKAVEDTACYRSAVLLSRNDVGFNPQNFSAPLTQFHQQNTQRAQTFPQNLLATATHDHKRGEDTRARLAVISERSVWFSEKIQQWQAQASVLRTELEDGVAPYPGDELILYQTLLGCWPLGLNADDNDGLDAFLQRLLRWQEKAVREAKLRSTWNTPHANYEAASREFLTRLLTAADTVALRTDIATAAASLAPAGALNSLSQTLLRMTSPGIPDLYQGAEFWDFSLVDPDNRQPVDFAARTAALAATVEYTTLLDHWQNGQVKQWLIQQTLAARQNHPELFIHGDYQPLAVEGEYAEQVVAFARQYHHQFMVVIVPRLSSKLLSDQVKPVIPAAVWGDTHVLLPNALVNIQAQIVQSLNNASVQLNDGRLTLADVLADVPVNFLIFNNQ